ncbi:MAG: hypothetical protein V3W04_13110 [Gammaproteobacteria bacterium]
MNSKRFADFWKGMFYLVGTFGVIIIMLLLVFVWQPLWTAGFSNFDTISNAIYRLDKTARPVAEMAPLMLGEMDKMRESIAAMEKSIATLESISKSVSTMNYSVNRMAWVVENRMGLMVGEMNQINDRMSPSGMMPFNW